MEGKLYYILRGTDNGMPSLLTETNYAITGVAGCVNWSSLWLIYSLQALERL